MTSTWAHGCGELKRDALQPHPSSCSSSRRSSPPWRPGISTSLNIYFNTYFWEFSLGADRTADHAPLPLCGGGALPGAAPLGDVSERSNRPSAWRPYRLRRRAAADDCLRLLGSLSREWHVTRSFYSLLVFNAIEVTLIIAASHPDLRDGGRHRRGERALRPAAAPRASSSQRAASPRRPSTASGPSRRR